MSELPRDFSALVAEYHSVRALPGRISSCGMTDRQYAGLWLHAFGDGERALAVLDSCPRKSRNYYLAEWPTLRELLLGAATIDQDKETPMDQNEKARHEERKARYRKSRMHKLTTTQQQLFDKAIDQAYTAKQASPSTDAGHTLRRVAIAWRCGIEGKLPRELALIEAEGSP